MKSLKFYGAIGGAVALVGCWPLAVGQIAQTAFGDIVTSVDNENISVELVEYDRGYLSSTAIIQVTVENEVLAMQLTDLGLPTQYSLQHQVSHGLTNVKSNTVIEQFKLQPLVIDTVTALNGATTVNVNYSDELEVELEQGALLTLSDWQVDANIDSEQKLTYRMAMPSITVADEFGAKLALSEIAIDAAGDFDQQVWLGTQTFSVGEFSVVEPQSAIEFTVSDIGYQFLTELDGESSTYNSAYSITAKQIVSAGVEAQNLEIAMSGNGFNADAVNKIAALTGQAELTEAELASVLDSLMTMLADGFSLKQDKFEFEMANGSFSSVWALNWPKQQKTQDILQTLMAVEGDFSAYVTKQLAESFPAVAQMVDELVVMEIATADDQGYQLKGTIKDANVEFANGQRIPLFMLLMPLMAGGAG